MVYNSYFNFSIKGKPKPKPDPRPTPAPPPQRPPTSPEHPKPPDRNVPGERKPGKIDPDIPWPKE